MTLVTDTGTNRPVRFEEQVFSSTNTATGNWIDIHGLTGLTLFFILLESAATLKIEVAHGAANPGAGG